MRLNLCLKFKFDNMEFWNYCPDCGKRLCYDEEFCSSCGMKTSFKNGDDNHIFTPPIHNIGFFNFPIDFSPYINTKADFEYDICSCGYLNKIDNEFCHHCGVKRIEKGISRFVRNHVKPRWNIEDFVNDEIICECGAVNSQDSEYCEMCGRKLHEDKKTDDTFLNYNLEYDDPIFCSCGKENDQNSLFCENCGLPLDRIENVNGMKKLCVCSVLNDLTADFCLNCGNDLNEEVTEIICVCGTRNPLNKEFCFSCNRPLNHQRTLKTKIVCSCGKILDFNSDFCPYCGKDIKRAITRKKVFSDTVNSVKKFWNGI